jgi:hypothetical protein
MDEKSQEGDHRNEPEKEIEPVVKRKRGRPRKDESKDVISNSGGKKYTCEICGVGYTAKL